MNKGRIIIISGPSGSGKTTLSKKLLASRKLKGKLVRSISMTTRPRRPGERHGRDYLFISRKMFEAKKARGHFLECEKVFQDYYGTPNKNVRDLLRAGKHVLLCIDVKGARTVRLRHPDALKIFIKTPTMDILARRLRGRGSEDPKALALRLKTAREELAEARHYDLVIVNDQLAAAHKRLEKAVCEALDQDD